LMAASSSLARVAESVAAAGVAVEVGLSAGLGVSVA
jgi:hypothetical protein